MSCSSCGTKDGKPGGCKNNGTCGTDGCNKLTVFDWLSNMRQPNGEIAFQGVEIRFKNERKEYFFNAESLPMHVGDVVAVEVTSGHDIGIVSLTGELVRVQMRKKKVLEKLENLPKIYRKASARDIQVWKDSREREHGIMLEARLISQRLGLRMKISDVEFQGDGNRATFYYTAEERIDFRQLIREFAARFGVRVEMKQIGSRQEASKVGGIGSCGRELCCSTWLTDFRTVSTASARYQQLSINPQKLAGQCGKLKCCLNFELDSYLDALDDIPKMDTVLKTKSGLARCMKVDVFKREMWLGQDGNPTWHRFTVEQVKEFVATNKKGQTIDNLEEVAKENAYLEPVFKDVIEENSLNRFERKNRRKRKPRGGNNAKRRTNTNNPKANRNGAAKPKAKSGSSRRKPNSPKGNSGANAKPTGKPSNRNNTSGRSNKNKGGSTPTRPQ